MSVAGGIFAAIVIGSGDTELRIYEYTAKRGMREVDCVSKRLNLGAEAYRTGRLDVKKVDELCRILNSFREIMAGYGVTSCEVRATSAMREIRSSLQVRDYIEKQTGLKVKVISNSEQRFLDYKSIASESRSFEKIIQKGTAIVDIGGNSIQISVFDNDKLITTQNIRMGKISSRERFFPYARNMRHYETLIRELMDHELAGFGKLYQKERQIHNLIVVDSDLLELIRRYKGSVSEKTGDGGDDVYHVQADMFGQLYDTVLDLPQSDLTSRFDLTTDEAQVVPTSLIFCRCLTQALSAETLWVMDVSICDGLAYDYGVKSKLIRGGHDFNQDIIAASRSIAKRYKCNQAHIRNMEEPSLDIFDRMKKIHGLGKRERLLLQISVILHNCGKYISLTNVADCAYNIIMATEIIGLSHAERQIIANVVRYNTAELEYYDDLAGRADVSQEEYLIIAKLTAILRVANALDRGHRQKFKGAVITLKENRLIIGIGTAEDLTLERITLDEQAPFFEDIFHIHPEIRQKKKWQGVGA